jgi:two-component system response regulator NreC
MPAHLHLLADSEASSTQRRMPITVILAVDHAGVRRSLRRLLDVDEGVDVIAESSDLAAAARVVSARAPRVVVVDLRLSDGSLPAMIEQLRGERQQTEVVVLTMDESPLTAVQAIDAGAIGFVLKDRADSELLEAVHSASRGDEFVSPRVAGGVDALRQAASDGLSPRETEVVRLIALGHTSAEIALKLNVSRRTVETQRARIYAKLGLANRAGLVQFALRRHLIGG